MKNKITFLLLCAGFLNANAQISCADAVAVGVGTHTVTFASGSQVPGASCVSGQPAGPRAAWYIYTPLENHNTTISSYVNGFNSDTVLQVYEGNCGNLTCVGGDDDGGTGETSLLTLSVTAGTTYYIVFDNRYDSFDFSFSLTENPFIEPMFTASPIAAPGEYPMAVVDMNGDYLDDLVAPSNTMVNILQQASNGSGFTPINRQAVATTFMPTWSIAAGDYNKDGYNDLLYGSGSGATIMLTNAGGTAFTTAINTNIFVFSQRTNFVDINEDGNLDAFICHDVQPNVYFLNDGTGGYEFIQGGLGDFATGGNYGSIWVDYNNDNHIDLFIAKCRGGSNPAGINELHRNDGKGEFTQIAGADYPEHNMSDITQTWSSAWGDYDNDGDMDVLIGASSDVNGSHKLMINDGSGNFTDGTAGSGYDVFPHLNIEHVAHDFNNDGWVDIFGGGQTIMFNNGDMTFTPQVVSIYPGPIGDLNNDGFLDIYNSFPTSAIFFNNANDNHWVKVTLEGIESNSNGIGARVEVYAQGDGWEKQIRDIKSGDGFEYMSSLNAHFGLGTTEEIEKIVVKWPSGIIDTILNPNIDEPIHVKEGEHVLSTEEITANEFRIYPNPVKDILTISGGENIKVIKVYDLTGKLVNSFDIVNNRVSLQSLAKGAYIVKMIDGFGKEHSSKIVKE